MRASSSAFSSPCAFGDQLAELLLLGAQLLEVGDGGAPGGVGLQGAVDDRAGQPALLLGGADQVGVVAEQSWVDHAPETNCRVERDSNYSGGGQDEREAAATGATAVLGLPYAVHSLPSLGR